MNPLKTFTMATLTAVACALGASALAAGGTQAIPPFSSTDSGKPASAEVAVLAGGCFWGVQGVFQHVKGVRNAVSGYAGGDKMTAVYEAVGSGRTGHAEAVQISFDPQQISYARILQIYFSVAHDPTQLNRQGPDSGPQYRSAIFPVSDEQARIARAYIAQLESARAFKSPIVTKIEPGHTFFAAEAYHQDYLTLNPNNPYIVYNDLPKIEDLRRLFADVYRAKPALVSDSRKPG